MMRNAYVFGLIFLLVGSVPAKAEKDWLYSVRPGDNLWNLCAQYTTKPDCWLKLGEYNSVTYPRQLPPGLIIRFPIAWLKEIPKTTSLSYFSGDVWTYSDHPDNKVLATLGEKLALGTTVITGEGSFATLRFDDGTLLQIEPNSELIIESQSNHSSSRSYISEIFLDSGAVKARVPERQPKSRFQIRTPSAIAAVRGTEYRLVSRASGEVQTKSNNVSITEVTEGIVAVSASTAAVDVVKGFSVTTEQGKPPSKPKPLLSAPLWADSVRAVQTTPLTLQWLPVAGAPAYKFTVLKDNDQAEIIESLIVNQTNYVDSTQSYLTGCYRFLLKAVDSGGIQGLPQTQRICLTEHVSAPIIEKPKIVTKPEQNIALQWMPTPKAQTYVIEISSTEDFAEIMETHNVDRSELILPWKSSYDQGFFYRIKAVSNDAISSDFSQVGSLSIDSLPGKALTAWSIFWVLVLAL